MKTLLSCEFNMDTGYVELRYSDSSMISINCTAVEDKVVNSRFQGLNWTGSSTMIRCPMRN